MPFVSKTRAKIMVETADPRKKALMLIGSEELQDLIKIALEKCDFEVEKF